MKRKLNWIISILIITILVVSGMVLATNVNKKVNIFKPSKSFIDRDDIKDIVTKDFFKRVIADDIDEEGIELFKDKGCLIKHRLKRSASFECPEEIIPELNVREARVFYILDLEADQQIKADLVWAEGIEGDGVNVVILDTGIDSNHIGLSDSIIGQKDFVNNDDIAEDDHGHGTHVAGIITANHGLGPINGNYATGVAPKSGIYMLKVCDAFGACYEDDMIAAMEYATSLDAKIMSISIGGGNYGSHCDSDPLAAKVNWLVDNGYTVAVAAGNDGAGVSSPACASKAIAVGAVDKDSTVVEWSNTGTALDIVAPGVNILSTYSCLVVGDCSNYWYAYMSGTSMATPHVSGVVALLRETNPALADNEIKNALYTTAEQTKYKKCTSWSRWSGQCIVWEIVNSTPEQQGAGLVNAYEAYLAVKPVGQDTDGDGIIDTDDACPTTYGTYCNGCPEPNCQGCQAAICPVTGTPYCEDDNSLCSAPNTIGTCLNGSCSYECDLGYGDCNSNMEDGCETKLLFNSNNCGSCGNVCQTIQCPESGCGVGTCLPEEFGYYPFEQQTTCFEGLCTGECVADCVYDASCDSDDDNDGVPDTEDACPTTYGTDCNGCPNPCSGCAVMNCPAAGVPTCEAGTCADTICPEDGCGIGTCAENEYGTYTSASNTCDVVENVGTCTNNPCTLECIYSANCETPAVKCWSAEYNYLKKSNSHQFKKICKCAEGNYKYNSYSYVRGRLTAYQYIDAADNENWDTKQIITNNPVYRVKCSDGNWYNTNQDHYYG